MERGLEVGKVERGWRVNVSGGLAHNTRFDFVGKMYVRTQSRSMHSKGCCAGPVDCPSCGIAPCFS